MHDHDFYEECRELLRDFIRAEAPALDLSNIPKEAADQMCFYMYKNYFSYEMDESFAARDAVSRVLMEYNIKVEGFESWIA